ncbi:hypothetical protein BASA62_007415 [Batrachochytrium salamandrivorans]|nr:hypothetical protein BASA62_007415 [Batrachochytrium salamandrivorans]
MRLSTGIILSILSTNVFAIEHPNGAHSGSLLARRAVVADADGPFLQKRSGDEDQKDQARPKKYSLLNSRRRRHAHKKGFLEDDPNPDPNYNDDTQKGTTDSRIYFFDQDRGATGGREDVHTDDNSDQQRLSLVDAPKDSPPRVFTWIRGELPPERSGVKWFINEHRLFITSDRVCYGLDGKKGHEIGNEVYRMLEYAFKSSNSFKRMYKDPVDSPFSLELSSTTPSGLKQSYKRLQKDVLDNIRIYTSAINTAIYRIFMKPKSVSFWLKEMLEKTNDFYGFILETRPRFSRLVTELEISDTVYLEGLEVHIKNVEKHKFNLFREFMDIEDMLGDYRANPIQRSTSKLFSSILRFRGLLGIKTKSSKDRALLEDVELEDPTSSND